MIALAASEMMPGSFCRAFEEALLMSVGPFRVNPSMTPAAMASASRFAAAVASAVCSRKASVLFEKHPESSIRPNEMAVKPAFIEIEMQSAPEAGVKLTL